MELEFEGKEQRVISDDGIVLMSMLPEGLADKWQEKAFKIIGRTKLELAAPDLLEALQELLKEDRIKIAIIESGALSVFNEKILKANLAIEKALK